MDQILKDKVAIVTGGSSGMGRAGVELFSAAGCQSVIADINEKEGNKIQENLTKKNLKADFIYTDVTDSKNVQSTVNQIIKKYGRIDILFHNAVDVPLVNNHDSRITELPEEIWHKINTLVFACSVNHSKLLAAILNLNGIKA